MASGSYNILSDPHLATYFNSPRMKQHLIKRGLITKEREIVSEKDFRNKLVKRSQRDKAIKICAQAMIDRAIQIERIRQNRIRQDLETINISQRVRKIKGDRRNRLENEVFRNLYSEYDSFIDLEAEEYRLYRTLVNLNIKTSSSRKSPFCKHTNSKNHSSENFNANLISPASGSREKRGSITCNDASHKPLSA
nr:hypothetical transcript [Hymenolepis microstoma]